MNGLRRFGRSIGSFFDDTVDAEVGIVFIPLIDAALSAARLRWSFPIRTLRVQGRENRSRTCCLFDQEADRSLLFDK
jgi:hypothetical protein